MRKRPSSVPVEAWWSPEENEWVLGQRDAEGKLQGQVRYWRPDGTLVSENHAIDGKPHGRARRFHENGAVSQIAHYEHGVLQGTRSWFATEGPTTEKMLSPGMSASIVRSEADYDRGVAFAVRFFDKHGSPISVDGEPLPTRPSEVPATAAFRGGRWIDQRWKENGEIVGLSRIWNRRGELVSTEEWFENKCKDVTLFFPSGQRRLEYSVRGGAFYGRFSMFSEDGSLLRRGKCETEAYEVETLDARGGVIGRASYAQAAPLEGKDSNDPDWIVHARAESPIDMAIGIAMGWGGDVSRDAEDARRARAWVRRSSQPSLRKQLSHVGLDTAPRVMTHARAGRLITVLENETTVDTGTLVDALIRRGGPGFGLAIADPKRAAGFLAERVDSKRLFLRNLGLTALPDAIGGFPYLAEIDLSDNRLETLPDALGDVLLLATLDLNRNRIRALPAGLAQLPWLSKLSLSGNGLSSLPAHLWSLRNLRTIDLSSNTLTTLPEATEALTELERVWLHDNPLSDLPRALSKLPLKFLHLGDAPWRTPPEHLAECTTLEHLWLASPSLEVLPEAICRLPRLKRLIVWYSSLRTVPKALFECTQLKELRIRDNPLPKNTIAALKEALPDCVVY